MAIGLGSGAARWVSGPPLAQTPRETERRAALEATQKRVRALKFQEQAVEGIPKGV